ncbi:endonuclease/exonuclease/phosphatase family protein [Sideroxydans lithotrophicus]|uniref:Endonuclease/exonuclease/phosphatase n=1 Tax=Sideroxydans lithotrophicus (strain ES-1) TaxID=580332 RepID=D5CQ52_SIDLE|nr:endonuclease/exonuclease/phosphatase family protein [Sideroxydans lithotrophicus]ADE11216.1 Endonuclease/exonuclease/phosphatase [Sideroxydans lithotrophicus ES-1]
MTTLKIATYNIHKGFSQFNRRVVLHELRERLRELDADIVFLQEVQGEHAGHVQRHADYPAEPQHEFLADEFWAHHAYGMNAVYDEGHHGNAVLSRFPILQAFNKDVSAHRFESRGLLHCEVEIGGQLVHCLCAHFGLFAKGQRAQMRALVEYVLNDIPKDAPLVIAGDFNDWRNQLSRALAKEIGVQDVFGLQEGKPARSFPSRIPVFRLDRIYVRGFSVQYCDVHIGGKWRRLSDHAALSAQLERI